MNTIKLNTIKFDLNGGGDVTKKLFEQLEQRVETITDMAPEELDTLKEVADKFDEFSKSYIKKDTDIKVGSEDNKKSLEVYGTTRLKGELKLSKSVTGEDINVKGIKKLECGTINTTGDVQIGSGLRAGDTTIEGLLYVLGDLHMENLNINDVQSITVEGTGRFDTVKAKYLKGDEPGDEMIKVSDIAKIKGELYIKKEVEEEVIDTDAYVDLGIETDDGKPLYFATCNVGASKPEEYGDYFMWGATEPSCSITIGVDGTNSVQTTPPTDKECTWVNTPYQTANTTSNGSTKFTKYLGSTSSSYKDPSATDENALKTVLDPEDDVVYVITGGKWRMPTSRDLYCLNALSNEWTTENGVYGIKWTSGSNTLFIPAAGYRYNGSFGNLGYYVNTWSSNIYKSIPYDAYYIGGNKYGSIASNHYNRCYGIPVRGVTTTPPTKTITKTILVPLKDVIEENEHITAAALNDLNNRLKALEDKV